jgi:transcriptional regulator with XRE-family HTH domain
MASRYDAQRARKTPPHVALQDLRAVSGKTLDQVCEAASEVLSKPLTRGALSAIENGHRGASTSVLRALEVAYGLRPGALVTDYEPREFAAVAEAS